MLLLIMKNRLKLTVDWLSEFSVDELDSLLVDRSWIILSMDRFTSSILTCVLRQPQLLAIIYFTSKKSVCLLNFYSLM